LKTTLCPRNFNDPYRVIPVHFEQLLDLSPAIHHILEYRDWLSKSKQVQMSKYLVDEMIVAFAFTNNRYRFHLFCKQFLAKWKLTGTLPIKQSTTFVGNFLRWLYKSYGSWSGVELRNGQSEGAIRHQTTKTHPILCLSLNKTLASFCHAADGMELKEPNLTNFRKTVQLMNESVEGSGNLLNQKSIAIVAGCGRVSNPNWLKHCIPGSSHHFTRLKQSPFFFTSPDQVMQLAHCLSSLGDQNGPMNGPKVDEVICKTLKGPSSEAMFHDIVIAGQDLYYTSNSGANLSIMCRRSQTTEVERVKTGGFASEPQHIPHYRPSWTEMCDATEYSSLHCFMSSETNYMFNIASKSEKKIEMELCHAPHHTFDIHNVQLLLNKNLYFALKEPTVFVADYLGVDPDQLLQAILVTKTDDGGWIATVRQHLMNGLDLQIPYAGILETETMDRRPLFGIKSQTRRCWSYHNEEFAFGALLLHFLFNTKMEFKRHWTKPLLQNTKELLLLFPCSSKLEKTILVCVIYRHEGFLWVKQFEEINCTVSLPLKIGKYYTKAEQEQLDMLW
jgi:hypothetical protein